MQQGSDAINGKNDAVGLPKGIVWEDVIKLLKEKKNQAILNKMDPITFEFVLKDENHQKVFDVLLKTLQKTDPEHATARYVENLIDLMKSITKDLLRGN